MCTLYSTADTGSASAVIGQPCCHTATVDTVSGGLKLLLFEDEFEDPEVVKISMSSTVEMNDEPAQRLHDGKVALPTAKQPTAAVDCDPLGCECFG